MSRTYQPDAAKILAVAEDERHTLLAQAAQDHLSRVEAEMRRYRDELAHSESVFASRLTPVPEVPEWITDTRKAVIAQALRLADSANAGDLASWLARARISDDLRTDPAALRRLLAGAASEPGTVYEAWLAASQLLQVSGASRQVSR